MNERRKGFEGGLAFSLAAVLPLLFSIGLIVAAMIAGEAFLHSQLYLYLAYFLPQLSILIVACVYFKRTATPLRAVYAPTKWYYFAAALLISFGLFSLTDLNALFLGIFERLGFVSPSVDIPELSGWLIVPALILIAVIPPIFEETLFRGICVEGLRDTGWGTCGVVLISGALFSLYHGNPVQTVYQLVCGCVYALLAVKSGSVFPSMLAHLANNAAILILSACGIEEFPLSVKVWLYPVAGAVLIATLVFLATQKDARPNPESPSKKSAFFAGAAVGILFCAVEWGSVFLEGWFVS